MIQLFVTAVPEEYAYKVIESVMEGIELVLNTGYKALASGQAAW
jgi:hypothetical protein